MQHVNLSKLREIVKVGEAWDAVVHGVAKSQTWPCNRTATKKNTVQRYKLKYLFFQFSGKHIEGVAYLLWLITHKKMRLAFSQVTHVLVSYNTPLLSIHSKLSNLELWLNLRSMTEERHIVCKYLTEKYF